MPTEANKPSDLKWVEDCRRRDAVARCIKLAGELTKSQKDKGCKYIIGNSKYGSCYDIGIYLETPS